jgi:hypothetical protein
MKVKGVIFEDFVNYRLPAMVIEMPYCSFKCDHECGKPVCQNGPLASLPNKEFAIERIIEEYIRTPIARAVVFQGLEPFDSFDDLYNFIFEFRNCYSLTDDIVIYTGYNKDEIENYLIQLRRFSNIVIKFGRYIPDCESHYDEVLGVKLASPNQYAERIN